MNSLKWRLIITHILPLMVAVPLIGVALIYILESQVLLSNLSSDLQQRAATIARTTIDQVDIWYDKDNAQAFVRRISATLNTPVMLFDPKGDILASSDPNETIAQGEMLQLPGLAQALQGKTSIQLHYPKFLRPEFADVLMPVVDTNGKVIGVIRLKDQLEGFQDRFYQLRLLIAWVIGIGLLMGVLLGWWLAFTLEKSLKRATAAISMLSEQSLSHGLDQPQPVLVEEGPSEIRSLTRAFNLMAERLQTLEVSRKRLLANLVHELGRPLGALRSALQALQSGADEDESLRYELLIGMDGEIGRLHKLLDDLAKLYHQPLGPYDLEIKPLDLMEWLPKMSAPWREAAAQKNINWQTSISSMLPIVQADENRLAQAVGNLFSNAIKYTPQHGVIQLVAVDQISSNLSNLPKNELEHNYKRWVQIEVINTGKPLAKEEQKKIFLPFYRGREHTRFPQGMGLGLTIAKDIVQAHQGVLEVESIPDKGNRFIIRLPVQAFQDKIIP